MSKGFELLRDYVEHDALCMRRRKCCDFEHELQQEFAALEAENEALRELARGYGEVAGCLCHKHPRCDVPYESCRFDTGGRVCELGMLNRRAGELGVELDERVLDE